MEQGQAWSKWFAWFEGDCVMGRDIGATLQQVSVALGAFSNAIRQATSPPGTYPQGHPYAPGQYGATTYPAPYGVPTAPAYPVPGPVPAPMPGDRMQWSAPAAPAYSRPGQPAQPVQPAPGGFMGALSAIWNGIVDFFKRLFGGGAPPAAAPGYPQPGVAPQPGYAGAWPAYNPDARAQAFQMFPSGNGLALGFVPVNVQKNAQMIVASGMGRQFKVYWQGNQLLFQDNNKAPQEVRNMTSQRQPDGTTTFSLTMADGKSQSADILPDGRTLRYQGYQVTLS